MKKRLRHKSVILFVTSVIIGIILSLVQNYYKADGCGRVLEWSTINHQELFQKWLHSRDIEQDEKKITEVEYLRKNVKVMCMVMVEVVPSYSSWRTSEAPNYDPAEKAISNTWGKSCTKTVYFSAVKITVPSIIINSSQKIESWNAVREAIIYVSIREETYDWYLLVEDDTFIIYENLLYYLSIFEPDEAHYLGHALISWDTQFNTIGAGVALSRKAVSDLRNYLDQGYCLGGIVDGSGEKVLGQCLLELDISVEDTRDHLGRARFLRFQPEHLLTVHDITWSFLSTSKFVTKEGPDCCGDYPISFHYVPPNMMYVFEYLSRHLRVADISNSKEGWSSILKKNSPAYKHSMESVNNAFQHLLLNNQSQESEESVVMPLGETKNVEKKLTNKDFAVHNIVDTYNEQLKSDTKSVTERERFLDLKNGRS